MEQLPRYAPDEIATTSDLQTVIEGLESRLGARIERVEADIAALTSEMRGGFAELNRRMDRLFQTVVGGLFVIVAAMATVMLTAVL